MSTAEKDQRSLIDDELPLAPERMLTFMDTQRRSLEGQMAGFVPGEVHRG